jgi:hypothetical protein
LAVSRGGIDAVKKLGSENGAQDDC